MLRTGHTGLALLAVSPILAWWADNGLRLPLLAWVAIALIAARVPDLDRRLPGVSHRGLTHTVWFVLLLPLGAVVGLAIHLGASGPSAGGLLWWGFLAAVAGGLSHLLGDALTPMGVRPLWPTSDRRLAVGLVRAGDPIPNYLLLLLGVGAIAVATTGAW